MATPQPGIFAQGTRAHRIFEYTLRSAASAEAVASALAPLRQPSVTAGGANIVIGFSPTRWRTLAAGVPAALVDFPSIPNVPDTQCDLWIWTHGTGEDILFDVGAAIAEVLIPVADLVSETSGWVYHDSRDLTGFVDGTENPAIEEAFEVATLPDGDVGAGGSFAVVQRWVHDLDAFHALAVTEQERVIGRTKPDSVELDDEAKPPTAHIARVVIEEDGEELEIYRRSVPYGTVAEHGLVFMAFSADPGRFEKMLRRMFGVTDDGLRDRLTDFSRPVTGGYYFVPSLEALGDALG